MVERVVCMCGVEVVERGAGVEGGVGEVGAGGWLNSFLVEFRRS